MFSSITPQSIAAELKGMTKPPSTSRTVLYQSTTLSIQHDHNWPTMRTYKVNILRGAMLLNTELIALCAGITPPTVHMFGGHVQRHKDHILVAVYTE